MKKQQLFLLTISLMLTTFSFSQEISNESFRLSRTFGDLYMRRYISGDLTYKRALVTSFNATASTASLLINYAGDYSDGVRIMGAKTVIDGNVGIGTTTPDYKLTVKGKIHSREVKVTATAGGADFVFEKEYDLPTLLEVEQFISKNKHLPEIASAKEMEKNGIHLAEMNIKLLQKIEELTLYTIEHQKKIEKLSSLKKENELLQKKFDTLESFVLKMINK